MPRAVVAQVCPLPHELWTTLSGANELVHEGRVRQIGLSNFHASEVARAFSLCNDHGLIRPTVYQGLYNPLNRLVESEVAAGDPGDARGRPNCLFELVWG